MFGGAYNSSDSLLLALAPCLTLSLSWLRAVHRRNRRDRRSTILRGYFSGPRDPANVDGAAEPA